MNRNGKLAVGLSLLGLVVACSAGQQAASSGGASDAPLSQDMSAEGMVPMFEVDPFFPKSIGNHWLMGPIIGVDVDSTDTVWIVHRNTPDQFVATTEIGAVQNPKLSECCAPGPPVLAFDQQGNLVHHWGGIGSETGDYVWPSSNHGITIDHMDNVWVGGNGPGDSHVLKFTKDGKFLAQYGKPGARKTGEKDGQPVYTRNSSDQQSFGRVAKIGIDAAANEAYIADGYFNRRVAVLDVNTGAIKRFWGAYGNKPDDADLPRYTAGEEPQKTFRGPVHCSEISKDGLVYVCDRNADRIQIFQKDGKFVSEHIDRPRDAVAGIDLGHRLLARPGAALHLPGRRPEHEGLHHRAQDDEGAHRVRRRRTSAGHVLRRPQHCRGQQGQHLHDGNLRRFPSAALRLQGHGSGAGGR